MKGSIPRSRRRFLEQRGAAVLAGIGEAVGAEARRYLVDEVLVTERVPFAPLVDLDRQIALQVMQGDVAQMRIFAHEIAAHDLDGGLYRGLLGTLGRALSLKLWAGSRPTGLTTHWAHDRLGVSAESTRDQASS